MDACYEELFARVVPMEVCCVHAGGSGSPKAAAAAAAKKKQAQQCLHHQATTNGNSRLHHHTDFMADLRRSAGAADLLAPGTPTGGCGGVQPLPAAGGLFAVSGLGGGNAEQPPLDACLCPNCCPNSYNSQQQQQQAGGDNGINAGGPQQAGSGELSAVAVQRINARVLGQKARYAAQGRMLPTNFRLELSCDDSLFFLFTLTIDEAAFNELKDSCDLSLTFQQLPGLLLQLLDLLVRQPSTYLARLFMQADGSAALEFAQTLGFKTLSLLMLPHLDAAAPSSLRSYVTARHNAVLERCADAEAELAELKALVRQRCPNLLLQAGKAPSPTCNRPAAVMN